MKQYLIALVISLYSASLFAYDFTVDNIYYNIISQEDKTCEVTYKASTAYSYTGDIVIPSVVKYNEIDYKVIGIGESTFMSCKLKTIQLPATIEYIAEQAFMSTYNLSSIIIPESVSTIGNSAFSYSKALTSVEIVGEGLREMGDQVFYECHLLKEFYMPNSVVSVGELCFSQSFNKTHCLEKVHLSESLQTIPSGIFNGCNNLLCVNIPSNTKVIGGGAFCGCTCLQEIRFPDKLEEIGKAAFCSCNSLTTIRIPNSVLSIGESAFAGSANFKLFEIGSGLKDISDVFGGTNLNQPRIDSLIIGNGISSMHDYTSIFGSSSFIDTWGSPMLFLLTNNKVDLYSRSVLGGTYHSPSCTTYVADVSIYSEDDITKFGIKNIVSSIPYYGEYNGVAPDINFDSNLKGYNACIDSEFFNVGSYTSMKVNYSKGDFSASISVPCDYTITKAPLDVIANDKTIYYGEEIPKFDCSYIGFKNNEVSETALTIQPTLMTPAKKGSDVGKYTINVSGAAAKNYSLSYTSGTLTIKKALQDISWNQTFSTYYIGDVVELNAKSSSGLPISYISSNENIAFVTRENGKQILHFVKDGTVKITATQQGNENYEVAQEISKSITIIARMASSISLNQTSAKIKEGESITLIPTIKPESVVEKGVTWKSADTTIASVDNGVVTAHKVGKAIITATTIDGSNLSATCEIEVEPILASSVSLSETSKTIKIGDSFTLTATVSPYNTTNKTIQWSSSNTSVASVDNGVVQTKNVGTTTIEVKTTDGSNITATCEVTVEPILVTSISLTETSMTLNVGEHFALSTTILPNNATSKDVSWSSSNNNVATVSNGVVTAIAPGSATITVKTADGSNKSASCIVAVSKIPVSSLAIDKESLTLLVDESATLSLSVYPINATNKTISWSSSNGSVATVSDGTIKAIGAGNATITAKATDGSGCSATCCVTVSKHQQMIIWEQELVSLQYGGELVELKAESSSGLPVSYTIADDDVASIFDMGNMICINPGNVGRTTITARQEGNDIYSPAEMTKTVVVQASDGIENIKNTDTLLHIYCLNGMKLGIFSKNDYHNAVLNGLIKAGVYIVNGKKIIIK